MGAGYAKLLTYVDIGPEGKEDKLKKKYACILTSGKGPAKKTLKWMTLPLNPADQQLAVENLIQGAKYIHSCRMKNQYVLIMLNGTSMDSSAFATTYFMMLSGLSASEAEKSVTNAIKDTDTKLTDTFTNSLNQLRSTKSPIELRNMLTDGTGDYSIALLSEDVGKIYELAELPKPNIKQVKLEDLPLISDTKPVDIQQSEPTKEVPASTPVSPPSEVEAASKEDTQNSHIGNAKLLSRAAITSVLREKAHEEEEELKELKNTDTSILGAVVVPSAPATDDGSKLGSDADVKIDSSIEKTELKDTSLRLDGAEALGKLENMTDIIEPTVPPSEIEAKSSVRSSSEVKANGSVRSSSEVKANGSVITSPEAETAVTAIASLAVEADAPVITSPKAVVDAPVITVSEIEATMEKPVKSPGGDVAKVQTTPTVEVITTDEASKMFAAPVIDTIPDIQVDVNNILHAAPEKNKQRRKIKIIRSQEKPSIADVGNVDVYLTQTTDEERLKTRRHVIIKKAYNKA